MKVLCAPDKFKGSLSAIEAAAAMASGVTRASRHCEAVCLPLADGGEGTVDALVAARRGELLTAHTTDPLGRAITSSFGRIGSSLVVMEISSASGLSLLQPMERDPFHASSFGTGELISAALDSGANEIILGVGGSATVDGGSGALQALGARLLSKDGCQISPGNVGLADLEHIDVSTVDARLADTRVRLATDVRNPLIGPDGAATVFGPQKGARPADIQVLERNLERFARVVASDIGLDVAARAGAGAAGGLAAGLLLIGATIESGIELVLESTQFDQQLVGAHFVLTGEGRLDRQSLGGKVVSGVVAHALRAGVPVFALAGCVRGEDLGALHHAGLTAAFAITDGPMTATKAYARAGPLVRRTAEAVTRLWLAHDGSNC